MVIPFKNNLEVNKKKGWKRMGVDYGQGGDYNATIIS